MTLPHRTARSTLPARRLGLLAGLALGLASAAAQAAPLEVSDARLRLLPGDLPAAGYFRLHNGGDAPVTLTGADSEAFGRVMLHRTMQEDGMSSMHAVDALEVAPGDTLEFAPGGYHLMLMKRARPLAVGDEVEVTLEFADDRELPVTFEAVAPTDL